MENLQREMNGKKVARAECNAMVKYKQEEEDQMQPQVLPLVESTTFDNLVYVYVPWFPYYKTNNDCSSTLVFYCAS